MKALINCILYDFDTLKKDYYVLFEREIIDLGPMSEFPGAQTIYNAKGCVVMPGLVVGHTHIYSTFARGWLTPFYPTTFHELLEQMWWNLDQRLDLDSTYVSGLVSGIEFIKNGVTTIIDHHASGKAILGSLNQLKGAICDDSGLRGIFCFESSDRFPIEECIEENVAFGENKTDQCAGLFGMHASMTLSNSSLEQIATARGNLPIHIHVAESHEDQVDSYNKYNKSVIERLNDYELLRTNSILSHCIHLEENEFQILKDKNLFIALNVTSNMNNGVGLPYYKNMKENDLTCILGNDGLGFNITRDMLNFLFAMHHLESNPVDVGMDDLKKVIRNTYEYASQVLGCSLGRIEKGYKADLITLPYIAPTEMTEENAMGHFVYGLCDQFHPRDMICNGELRMKDFKVNLDEERIYSEARRLSKKLWGVYK